MSAPDALRDVATLEPVEAPLLSPIPASGGPVRAAGKSGRVAGVFISRLVSPVGAAGRVYRRRAAGGGARLEPAGAASCRTGPETRRPDRPLPSVAGDAVDRFSQQIAGAVSPAHFMSRAARW